ncbi:MAG: hypothetical protein AAGF19_01905 [Pseudomonadota bacterium]
MKWLSHYPIRSAGGLVLLTLPIHAALPWLQSAYLAALSLAAVAGVYFGFAVKDGRDRSLLIESVGVVLFVAIAYGGLTYNPRLSIYGFILHGFWDIAHTNRFKFGADIPRWYIPFCAAYDWLFAAGLWTLWIIVPALS